MEKRDQQKLTPDEIGRLQKRRRELIKLRTKTPGEVNAVRREIVEIDRRLAFPKLTKSEAGRLGGRIGGLTGGKRSRGGGRPRKYGTEAERKAAAVARQTAYRERQKIAKRSFDVID